MAFPIANYHTHTPRCKHAQGTDRDYVRQALESGYQVLGFTDHVAWPFSDGFVSPIRMDADQMPEYAASILKLKEEYAGRLTIRLGAECECFPDYLPWLKEQREALGLEYLILGVHYPPNEEGFPQFASAAAPEELERYTDLAIAGMETGLFACLCHPDLPLKTYPRFDAHARNMSEILCRRARELDLPLEYNLAGLRLRDVSKGWGYTSDEFWDIAARYGCKAVIASDAHEPEVLARTEDIAAARNKLTALGIQVLDLLPGLD